MREVPPPGLEQLLPKHEARLIHVIRSPALPVATLVSMVAAAESRSGRSRGSCVEARGGTRVPDAASESQERQAVETSGPQGGREGYVVRVVLLPVVIGGSVHAHGLGERDGDEVSWSHDVCAPRRESGGRGEVVPSEIVRDPRVGDGPILHAHGSRVVPQSTPATREPLLRRPSGSSTC